MESVHTKVSQGRNHLMISKSLAQNDRKLFYLTTKNIFWNLF